MTTILVSGASGVVGYGVLRSLRMAGAGYQLIGTTIYNDSVAPAFCDVFERAPMTTDTGYIDWLRGVIKKHQVDMIIPGIEADMLKWNQERSRIETTGAKALLNNPALIALCADKWNFYEAVRQNANALLIDTRLAGTFDELVKAFGLPFLLKPRRGFASKGIVIVESEATFNEHRHDLDEVLMAQPIVGDNEHEYTVSAFFDADSTLLCHMGLKRKLAKEGFTEKAEVTDLLGVVDAMTTLAASLKPIGPTNFQFRLHEGQLKLLEINPRISSATSIRAAFGYNESVMAVEFFLRGTLPTQPAIKRGYAVRYTEDHIFYESDTV